MNGLMSDYKLWEHGLNAQIAKLTSLMLIIICTLLVSRLVFLLFAARPDNGGIALLLSISAPFAWPLSWIDAQQPIYGARFERGTLLSIVMCLTGLYLLRRYTK
jgi:hypothetical protein